MPAPGATSGRALGLPALWGRVKAIVHHTVRLDRRAAKVGLLTKRRKDPQWHVELKAARVGEAEEGEADT